MWLIDRLRSVIKNMLKAQANKAYPQAGVKQSGRMTTAMGLWHDMRDGRAPWVDEENNVTTLKFNNIIASRAANLATLDIDVAVSGSARAAWLQEQFDKLIKNVLRDKVEVGLGTSGIMIKPTGDSVSYFEDTEFLITDYDSNGRILGAIFRDVRRQNKKVYTRYEWNYLDKNGVYWIYNKAFESDNENEEGREVPLNAVGDWANLPVVQDITTKSGKPIDSPLFAYFKNPAANKIDTTSPQGVAIFADAIEVIKSLDIAWSRAVTEVEDSQHITFMSESAIQYDEGKPKRTLPRFVQGFEGGTETDGEIHEHVATLLTDQRWSDINNKLSLVGTMCGFTRGAFSVDKQTGMITATQVESDDRDTIQTIKDIRDALKECMNDLLYALNVVADLFNLAPTGKYEVAYNFGDITYNYDEDKARWWNYVVQGKIPDWKYFEKFEGMSREEYEELQGDLPKPDKMFNDEE